MTRRIHAEAVENNARHTLIAVGCRYFSPILGLSPISLDLKLISQKLSATNYDKLTCMHSFVPERE